MKRFFTLTIFIFTVLLFSCTNVTDDGGTAPAPVPVEPSDSQENWSGNTVEKIYSNNNYMFEVTNTTRNLDITLPEGNYDVYAVQLNNSDYTVKASQNQYIVQAGFLRSARNANDGEGGFVLAEDLEDDINLSETEIPEEDGGVKRVHFVDTFVPPPFYGNSAGTRSASLSYLPPSPSYSPGDVGDIKKDIFVDVDPNHTGSISYFAKKKATLEAVGTHCYVWVVKDYLGEGFNQINSLAAIKMKDSFDGFYEYVRYAFGHEADFIITGPNSTRPMSDIKVNIVVYDILGDSKTTQNGGVLGYFSSKDYYATSYDSSTSNEGKYFYIDSYFAKKWPGEIYSTLAHEFQHMISFSVKQFQEHVHGYAGYNEMLSMLCEDMLQTKMNVTDLNSPKGRFLNFMDSYYKYGIFDNPNDAYYYSVAYMFGAFLARNYGGAKLVSAMAKNGYRNAESITAALHELHRSETFEDVLMEYAKALVLPSQTDKTFNIDAPTYDDFQLNGYNFPMTKFDIFNFKDKDGNTHSMKAAIHKNRITNKSSRKDLHGKGIIPYYVGTAKHGGDLRLTFSSPENPNAKVYVLVNKK